MLHHFSPLSDHTRFGKQVGTHVQLTKGARLILCMGVCKQLQSYWDVCKWTGRTETWTNGDVIVHKNPLWDLSDPADWGQIIDVIAVVNTLYQAIKLCSRSKETITQEGRVVSYLCLQQWGPFNPPRLSMLYSLFMEQSYSGSSGRSRSPVATTWVLVYKQGGGGGGGDKRTHKDLWKKSR